MTSKRYVLKGLAGVGIGLGYGLLAGALVFLSVQLTDPGPMIPDNHGWGLLVMVYVSFIAGVCGALVGLVVGLSGMNKQRGAMMGAAMGLMLCLPWFVQSCSGLSTLSWPLHRDFFLAMFFFLLVFPVGLASTGIVVSIVTRKLDNLRRSRGEV